MPEGVNNDDVQIGQGASGGALIATEYEPSSASHYQIVKLAHGGVDYINLVATGAEGTDGTGGRPMPVQLFADSGGTASTFTKIGSSSSLNVNVLGSHGATAIPVIINYPGGVGGTFAQMIGITGTVGITSGAGLSYYGITGGDIIVIRGLTAGPTSGSTGSLLFDHVNVQGMTQGYPVRAAIWTQDGATALGISGDTSALSYIVNEVGVTFDTTSGLGITIGIGGAETGLNVTAGAAGANWGITTSLSGVWVKSTDLDIRSLTGGTGSLLAYTVGTNAGESFDSVIVQGASLGYPVGARLYAGDGNTVAPVGMSGTAIDVNILDAGITVTVDVTDTNFMIQGITAASMPHPVRIAGFTGESYVRVVASGTGDGLLEVGGGAGQTHAVVVAGLAGATAMGVTQADIWNVRAAGVSFDTRGITAGPTTGAGGAVFDSIGVQGMTEGYPVRSTIWTQDGATALGISGDTSALSYIVNEVGITFDSSAGLGITVGGSGTGLNVIRLPGTTWGVTCDEPWNIRSLTGGTGSLLAYTAGTHAGASFDSVIVQGASLGYPVGSRLYAGAGNTVAAIGISGNALNVNILDAGITVNVDVTDTSFMIQGMSGGAGTYVGVPVRIEGQTGGTVQIGGVDGATAVAVTGGGPGGNWGITVGTALNVQAWNTGGLEIRGLTYGVGNTSDWVGVTGDLYSKIAGISAEIDRQGITLEGLSPTASYPDVKGLARQVTFEALGSTIDNVLDGTTKLTQQPTLLAIQKGMSGPQASITGTTLKNVNEMAVRVESTKQPTEFYNGQTSLTLSAARLDGSVPRTLKSGLNIKSHQQNGGKVFIGLTGVLPTTGYPLSAGEELFIEIENTATIFAVGDIDGLTACYIGM